MFVTSIILSGISLLGLNEIYNYFNYRRVVNASQAKQQLVTYQDGKSTWIANYISSMDSHDIRDWIVNNIRAKDNITIENVSKIQIRKLLSYNIYNKAFKKLSSHEQFVVDNIIVALENKLHIRFSNEIMNRYDYYKFGNNEIISVYKPTIFYSALYFIKKYSYNVLTSKNFVQDKVNSVTYFYKKSSNSDKYIMFIHGLGFGSTPYLNFIMELVDTDCNIIIPILPNISNMEFDDNLFPNHSDIIETFTEIITKVGITEDQSLNVIAHSFGTIITAILLNDNTFRRYIKKKVLVDPVCFINKYYKIFQYIDNPYDGGKIINKIFNACVYDDIYVRYATQRFLCGHQFWISDMTILENSIVVLSGKDKIVPSHDILNTLQKEGILSIISEEAAHGDIFFDEYKDIQRVIVDFIKN